MNSPSKFDNLFIKLLEQNSVGSAMTPGSPDSLVGNDDSWYAPNDAHNLFGWKAGLKADREKQKKLRLKETVPVIRRPKIAM